MRFVKLLSLVCVVALMATTAQATVVGYYTDGNPASTDPAVPIQANGFTAVQISNIATFDFNTVDWLFINNSQNGQYSGGLLGREADIDAFVSAGGGLMVHDRGTGLSSPGFLPGGDGITMVRSPAANIDVVTAGTLVTDGPFGTINDTTLDGGNSSHHGWAVAGTLPGGAINILNAEGNDNNSAAFSYGFGGGNVYYSSIPLDFYLAGADPAAFREIYAPNAVAFLKVPEPTSLALLAVGGFFAARRRR